MKPLGRKAYGSIPHLPGSRLGPGDYKLHEGQERICFEGGADRRGRKHRVIVTEKLDGSNVAVAKVNGQPIGLVRAGYAAQSSPRKQHQIFAAWVRQRAWDCLPEGWRISGEWLHQAHGTIYRPNSPFVAFDVFDEGNSRLPYDEARALMASCNVIGAHVISDGGGMTIDDAMKALGERGFHGAQEQVEGAVWRVETSGAFNFLAKYVRQDKVDGKYFGAGEDGGDIFMCDPLEGGE